MNVHVWVPLRFVCMCVYLQTCMKSEIHTKFGEIYVFQLSEMFENILIDYM